MSSRKKDIKGLLMIHAIKIRKWAESFAQDSRKVLSFYVVSFAVFFAQISQGVGQYWDWSFPVFKEHIANFFARSSMSWTPGQMGSPLGYVSDYFVRFIVSLFRFVQPEVLLYSLLILLFAASALGVYLILRPKLGSVLSIVIGFAALLNPAIFYKYTAGHFDYFVSYAVFIYLIYYLFYKFNHTFQSAVILGLFLAFVGAQIQFFAFAVVLLIIVFAVSPRAYRLKQLPIITLLPLLINLVWLANFMDGAASVASISGVAAKGSFTSLTDTNLASILTFSFAKATLIGRFFTHAQLILYTLLLALAVYGFAKSWQEKKSPRPLLLLSFIILFIFLTTGIYQRWNLGPLATFYPMFRESGHFAPLIILSILLLVGWTLPMRSKMLSEKLYVGVATSLILATCVISGLKFQENPQKVNIASLRNQFQEFENFSKKHVSSNDRVLEYPFFDQYALQRQGAKTPPSGLGLSNTGHDSYSAFAEQQFVKTGVKPQDFQTSLQYQLLLTKNVDVLRPYNIRYIYDFTNIYESNYDRYVSSLTYNNDLTLIKNNKNFFSDLLASNPGKLRRVSEHILEITNYAPRIAADSNLYQLNSVAAAQNARSFIQTLAKSQGYYKVGGRDQPGSTSVSPLFDEGAGEYKSTGNHTLHQTVRSSSSKGPTALYASEEPTNISYDIKDGALMIYANSSGKLLVNNTAVFDASTQQAKELLHLAYDSNRIYYAQIGSVVRQLLPNTSAPIGPVAQGSEVKIFASMGSNLIKNPSFETGLWQNQVADCNAYDKSPLIKMSLSIGDASAGKNALLLSSSKHIACTSTAFSVRGGSQYLLSYDYKGVNSDSASYFIPFNGSNNLSVKGKQTITNHEWNTFSTIFTSPSSAKNAQIFIHANPNSDGSLATNMYDNFDVAQVEQVGQADSPMPSGYGYKKVNITPASTASIDYVDSQYTYENLINNGSFEQGGWQPEVTDCSNYDMEPDVAMTIDKKKASDGKQSILLRAAHHTACTYTTARVTAGQNYLLSFDYRSSDAKQFGYKIKYDDATGTVKNQAIMGKMDGEWHTFERTITVPAGSTAAKIYLYVQEPGSSKSSTVGFDNTSLIGLPPLSQRFFLVNFPSANFITPKSMAFQANSATKRTINIKGARTPFYLSLSESYHPMWRLSVKNGAVVSSKGHFMLSDYANGWYIDPQLICKAGEASCIHNSDGTYDLTLVAYFTPQSLFQKSLTVSVATIGMATGYLIYSVRKRRR